MSRKIATLRDFANDDDEERPPRDNGNQYYAGGSTHSGQLVEGPPQDPNHKVIEDLLKLAQDGHGRENYERYQRELEEARAKKKQKKFQSKGHRLGDGTEEEAEAEEEAEDEDEDDEPRLVRLTYFKDGFTVDDGELRPFADPANEPFLAAIQRGVVPQELARGSRDVSMEMIDRRGEMYSAPKKQATSAFGGAGYTLGSLTPEVTTTTATTSAAAAAAASSETASPVAPSLTLDPAQPVTTLQLRLMDGTRLVGKFNPSHTIGQLMAFIRASRANQPPFELVTTFPSRIYADPDVTLEQAGLLGAVVMQRKKQC